MNVRKSLKLLLRQAALPAALVLLAAQPACGVFGSRGPSAVAEGQRFTTGDPTYDQFFGQVHELAVELDGAPDKEKSLRIALARQLDLDVEEEVIPAAPASTASTPAAAPTSPASPSYGDVLTQSALGLVPGASAVAGAKQQYDATKAQIEGVQQQLNGASTLASPGATAPPPVQKRLVAPGASLLARAVKERAEKLNVGLRLELDRDAALEGDDATAKLQVFGEPVSLDGRKLGRQVETTAAAELTLLGRMARAERHLERLSTLVVALEGSVDDTFRRGGLSKKNDVRKNLADARKLIAVMQARAKEVSGKADEVVTQLSKVAQAEPPAPKAAESTPEVKTAKRKTPGNRRGASATKSASQPAKASTKASPYRPASVKDFVP